MPFPSTEARYDPYTGSYGSWIFNDGSGSLPGTPEEYQSYFGLQDPGVNVVTGYGTPDATTTNYSSTPFFGFPDGGQTFISNDPAEIANYRENERTRNLQGALQVAALVGGGAIGNALLGGAAGAGGAASGADALTGITLPSSAVPITSGAIPAGMAAGPSAATLGATGPILGNGSVLLPGGATAAIGGGKNALNPSGPTTPTPGWVGNYLMPGLSTVIGANAANNATDAQTAANQAAIDESRRQFDTTRTDLMPWLNAGRDALGRLSDPKNSFTNSPGFQAALDRGLQSVTNSASAKGTLKSGNALRRLQEVGIDYENQDFGNWWNQQAGLAGVGQTTATTLGDFGANNSKTIGNYLSGIGDARASGVLGRNAALIGGINQGYRNYLYGRP